MQSISRILGGAAVVAAAGPAMAGGLDRGPLNYAILFQPGSTVEVGVQSLMPDLTGTYPASLGGGSTGNMAKNFTGLSLSFKADVNKKLSYAFLVGEPIAAGALYPSGFYTGLEANWSTEETTALLRYKLGGGTSVFGGLRYLTSSANIDMPSQFFSGTGAYTATAARNSKPGYVIGVAWERPDIAARVSLTYVSQITHDFATTEYQPLIGTVNGVTDIVMPQSVELDGQTGIAAGTLLLGSVRWAEWSKWHVKPPGYAKLSGGQEITGFDSNVTTWTLGLGRKITENLSMIGSLSYEAPTNGPVSTLAPIDGMRSATVGAVWTQDKMTVTAGLRYEQLGNGTDSSGTRFEGNHAVVAGLKVGYSF